MNNATMGNHIKRNVIDGEGKQTKYSDYQNAVRKANEAQWEFNLNI